MANTDELEITSLKDEGNRLFQKRDYAGAITLYSRAIVYTESCLEFDFNAFSSKVNKELVSVLYCNRAACQMRLAQYSNALQDAEKALKWNPQYHKAHYRLGDALTKLKRYKEAQTAFENSRKIILQEMSSGPSLGSQTHKSSLHDTESALEAVQLLQLLPQEKPEFLQNLSDKEMLETLSNNVHFLKSEKFAKEVCSMSVRLGATGRRCVKAFVVDENGRLLSNCNIPVSPIFSEEDKKLIKGLKEGELQTVNVFVQVKFADGNSDNNAYGNVNDYNNNNNNISSNSSSNGTKLTIAQQQFFIQSAQISRFPSRPLSPTQSLLLTLSANFANATNVFNKHFASLL